MKNSKKLLSILLLSIFILSLFSITAFSSDDGTVYISEDFQELFLNEERYIKFNGTQIASNFSILLKPEFAPLESQKETISYLYIYSHSHYKKILRVTIYFSNGDTLETYYLHHSYYEEYENTFNSKVIRIIDYPYYQDDFPVSESFLEDAKKGKKVILSSSKSHYFDLYEVVKVGKNFNIIVGYLFVENEDVYYFVDLNSNKNFNFSSIQYNDIEAIKLEDSPFLQELKAVKNKSDDYSFFGETISKIIIVFLFIIIPAITLILGIIFSTMCKNKFYKKLWLAVSALCLVGIVVCIIIIVLL